jgi:hypothetical protein
MLSLIGIPAKAIDETASPKELSYLLATDAPVIFEFQRNEGNIDSAAETTSPSGWTELTMDGTYVMNEGDRITIYDSGTDTMLRASVMTDLGGDRYEISLWWEARYATDLIYILNGSRRANYYVEIRLLLNGVYTGSLRYSPDIYGSLEADISSYLRSAVSGEKIGNYLDDIIAETNQSGEFELEYRERYAGDASAWVKEGNTWYYVYAIRSKEQGANLSEYVMTTTEDGKFFNEFAEPIWYIGTPLDIQFWWNPDITDLNLIIKQFDAANIELDSQTIILDNANRGYLASVSIALETVEGDTDYLTIEVEEP